MSSLFTHKEIPRRKEGRVKGFHYLLQDPWFGINPADQFVDLKTK